MSGGKGGGTSKKPFTYEDGATPSVTQFQKVIQELRTAVESRDRIIQQYKDHMSETTRENERLDAELQDARQKADSLADHLKRRDRLLASQMQTVMQGVDAARTMAQKSLELATHVQQAPAAAPGARRPASRHRADERFVKNEIFNLSREIESDENRLVHLVEEDAWAAWLLWGSRQYGACFDELDLLVRSADAFQDRNTLEELRRRATAMGSTLQAQENAF